jgi:hypothetical protein
MAIGARRQPVRDREESPLATRNAVDREIQLLRIDPGLGEDLAAEDLESANRQVTAKALTFPTGPWRVGPDDFDPVANLGLLLIDGLLTRQVTVADYTCADVLGPGDVLQPWLRQSVATEIDCEAVALLRMAVLDRSLVGPQPSFNTSTSARDRQIQAAFPSRSSRRS